MDGQVTDCVYLALRVSPVLLELLVMVGPKEPPECPASAVQPAPLEIKAKR